MDRTLGKSREPVCRAPSNGVGAHGGMRCVAVKRATDIEGGIAEMWSDQDE